MKLLIIQQKMIGDVLTSSILFEAIKAQYPKAECHYLINSHTFPVVEYNPFIDEFVFFTPEIETNKLKFFQFLKTIKKEKYDVVIDVYSKLSSNLITLFSEAKTKISQHKGYTKFFYTHTFKNNTKAKTNAGLAIENRLQLLQPLNINTKPITPKIYLTNDEIVNAKQFLKTNGVNLNNTLFMISVLGSNATKTYPYNYMAQVIDTIVATNKNCNILFNYIPKQENEAKAIYNLCQPNTQHQILFNVFGKSLREFLAITKHCNAVIGNEGGAINMAKALNIRTFSIYSPWISKKAWSLFEDGKTHVSVHLKDFKPKIFNVSVKVLKENNTALYKAFKPLYFKDILTTFLTKL